MRTADFALESERLDSLGEGVDLSAYLKFFELEQAPFEGDARRRLVLGTEAVHRAFGTIQSGLSEGASRICVSGQDGLGKTSLARALPKLLQDEARVAIVGDPTISWDDCRSSLTKQWSVDSKALSRSTLLEARSEGPLVVVIDEAERASEEFLAHLDVLLSFRTETGDPVVQSVLLANLSTEGKSAPAALLWWLDRLQTLQLEFQPLPREGVGSFLARHLRRAGWRGDALFTEDAGLAIHGYTGGVPGTIYSLCERLLIEAAAQKRSQIDASFVHSICNPDPFGEILDGETEGTAGYEDRAFGLDRLELSAPMDALLEGEDESGSEEAQTFARSLASDEAETSRRDVNAASSLEGALAYFESTGSQDGTGNPVRLEADLDAPKGAAAIHVTEPPESHPIHHSIRSWAAWTTLAMAILIGGAQMIKFGFEVRPFLPGSGKSSTSASEASSRHETVHAVFPNPTPTGGAPAALASPAKGFVETDDAGAVPAALLEQARSASLRFALRPQGEDTREGDDPRVASARKDASEASRAIRSDDEDPSLPGLPASPDERPDHARAW